MHLTGIHIVVMIMMGISIVMIMTDTLVMVTMGTMMIVMISTVITIVTSTMISTLIEVMTGIMMRKISVCPHPGVPTELGLQIIPTSMAGLMTLGAAVTD